LLALIIGCLSQRVRRLLLLERHARRVAEGERERATDILESITDGFFTLDRRLRFTYINGVAERYLRRQRDTLLGRSILDEFPEIQDSRFHRTLLRVLRDRV